MKKWSVSLANDSCIFDSATGFDNLEAAIEWSLNRGGDYIIEIDDGKNFPVLKLCAKGEKLLYEKGYGEWEKINIKKFCEVFG